jgi:prepilin peptidase CpaA
VLNYLILMLFPAALAYAAVMDIFTMTISNRISLALIAGFPLAAIAAGLPMATVLMHVAAFAIVLALGFTLFSFKLLGGGDAKILATASLWVGLEMVLPFVAIVTVWGGFLALAFLSFRKIPLGAFPLPEWAARLHKQGNGIPYGLAICAGGMFIYPTTALFKALMT